MQAVGKKKLWSTKDILNVEEYSVCETFQAFLSLKLHSIDVLVLFSCVFKCFWLKEGSAKKLLSGTPVTMFPYTDRITIMLFLFQISSVSVQSNTVQSVQSSYNPFEDEEDTGSTVSEKEDNKIKKLVKSCFLIVSTFALSLSRVFYFRFL